MSLPLSSAHRRYTQQAGWTTQLRRHIFTRAGLPNAHRVLEIGCGTGAVLASIPNSSATVFGLDIDKASLLLAKTSVKNVALANGDAHQLPFLDATFDISFFHYVLLWLKNPAAAVSEARRVTLPGGAVIGFAEPDYSQSKTSSLELTKVNELQMKSLRSQGADPTIGSRLAALFSQAGVPPVEIGQIDSSPNLLTGQDLELELEMIKSDLTGSMTPSELEALIARLRETKDFVVFQVPTFFCWGRVI